MEELKPCPLCGREAKLQQYGDWAGYSHWITNVSFVVAYCDNPEHGNPTKIMVIRPRHTDMPDVATVPEVVALWNKHDKSYWDWWLTEYDSAFEKWKQDKCYNRRTTNGRA